MKVSIVFSITNDPTGGGNQFIRCLKNEFIKQGVYSEIENADVVLFNSHHCIDEILRIKHTYPDKLYVHRIDGPMRLCNNLSDKRDQIANNTNKYIADATVFQSEWSKNVNLDMGLETNSWETVILNATDENIFNRVGKIPFEENRKIKLIASSWSNNVKKGFKAYQYLDEHLDFQKYDMTFVGNSPVKFKNIKSIEPKPSGELAKILKENDIYITASQKDPCSNSLIEALACGLPAICYNDGGHPEILQNAGCLFDAPEEIPSLIERIVVDYDSFQACIKINNISDVAVRYIDFFKKVLSETAGKRKRLSFIGNLNINIAMLRYKYS